MYTLLLKRIYCNFKKNPAFMTEENALNEKKQTERDINKTTDGG